MPKDLPTISLQEIMRGGAMKSATVVAPIPVKRRGRAKKMAALPMEGMGTELLANQPASDPNLNIIEGDVEGGKLNMKKVRRVYKKHVRPVVSAVVKAAVPAAKMAAKTAITGALVSKNVPPGVADKIASAISEQGVNMAVSAANTSGVTKGAGLKVPSFRALISGSQAPAMLGGALSSDAVPIQMQSGNAASFAAARMQLTKERAPPEVKPFRTESLPVQMQSNPQFTNMALIGGRGLYGGQGLYLSGRSQRVPGRGLF